MDYTCTFLMVYYLEMLQKHYLFLHLVKISHVSIWNWIQKIQTTETKEEEYIDEFIIDETAIKAGGEIIWLWIVIESIDREILSISISKERNMFVAHERFLSIIVNE